jgi:monoamine oxidase
MASKNLVIGVTFTLCNERNSKWCHNRFDLRHYDARTRLSGKLAYGCSNALKSRSQRVSHRVKPGFSNAIQPAGTLVNGSMRVGVLGGGLQGCCVALSLAERGVDVTLFDRNDRLLSRAAVANEGKIHLGYMYANDPSHSTARMMMQGCAGLRAVFRAASRTSHDSMTVSRPAAYVVHRDSQRTPNRFRIIWRPSIADPRGQRRARRRLFWPRPFSAQPRMWSAAEREAQFDPRVALAAFDTPEVAIDPAALADAVRTGINADPRIDIRLQTSRDSVDGRQMPRSCSANAGRKCSRALRSRRQRAVGRPICHQ